MEPVSFQEHLKLFFLFLRKWELSLKIDCKTVIFFANVSDGPYSNGRFEASIKTARENGERRPQGV